MRWRPLWRSLVAFGGLAGLFGALWRSPAAFNAGVHLKRPIGGLLAAFGGLAASLALFGGLAASLALSDALCWAYTALCCGL